MGRGVAGRRYFFRRLRTHGVSFDLSFLDVLKLILLPAKFEATLQRIDPKADRSEVVNISKASPARFA
jgi:hypothetical protein